MKMSPAQSGVRATSHSQRWDLYWGGGGAVGLGPAPLGRASHGEWGPRVVWTEGLRSCTCPVLLLLQATLSASRFPRVGVEWFGQSPSGPTDLSGFDGVVFPSSINPFYNKYFEKVYSLKMKFRDTRTFLHT